MRQWDASEVDPRSDDAGLNMEMRLLRLVWQVRGIADQMERDLGRRVRLQRTQSEVSGFPAPAEFSWSGENELSPEKVDGPVVRPVEQHAVAIPDAVMEQIARGGE